MSGFKPQQRHIVIGNRTFHFVSYEAQEPNLRRGVAGSPPMWFLMVEGRRWPALPYDPNQDLVEADEELMKWARANALPPRGSAPPKRDSRPSRLPSW